MRTLVPNEKAKLDFGLLGPRCRWEILLKEETKIRELFTGGLTHRRLPRSRSDHSRRGWQRRSDHCDSSTKQRTAVRDDGWEVDAIQQLDREEWSFCT